MENIKIDKISVESVENLQVIGKQTFYETFAENNTEEDIQRYLNESFAIDKLKSELENPNSDFFIAFKDENPIGYLKLNRGIAQTEVMHENTLEIERIYVLQEYHKMKIGKLLIEKAIVRADQLLVDYIWLGVWEKNLKAIGFYKKAGFVEFDKHIFLLGNDEQIDILMRKKVSTL